MQSRAGKSGGQVAESKRLAQLDSFFAGRSCTGDLLRNTRTTQINANLSLSPPNFSLSVPILFPIYAAKSRDSFPEIRAERNRPIGL